LAVVSLAKIQTEIGCAFCHQICSSLSVWLVDGSSNGHDSFHTGIIVYFADLLVRTAVQQQKLSTL